jgi:hypothetical protein
MDSTVDNRTYNDLTEEEKEVWKHNVSHGAVLLTEIPCKMRCNATHWFVLDETGRTRYLREVPESQYLQGFRK